MVYYDSELDAFECYHLQQSKEARDASPHHRYEALPALAHAVSGAVGSSLANFATYPLDLITTRLQVQRQLKAQRERRKRHSSHHTTTTTTTSYSGRDPSPSKGLLGKDDYRVRKVDGEGGETKTVIIEETTTDWGEDDEEEYYEGFFDAVEKIYDREGWGGFYTGITYDTISTVGSAFSYFAVYNYLRTNRLASHNTKKLPILEELAIGLAANAASKFFASPLSTIVTRKQTAAILYPKAKTPSVMDIFHDVMREKGITGFWSGYSASLLLGINPSITFMLYESFKGFAKKHRGELKAEETFLLAAVAKAVATSITYPLTCVKTRTQVPGPEDEDYVTQELNKKKKKKMKRAGNFMHVLLRIIRKEGLGILYEGVGGQILKGFFANGVTMLVKENVHRTIIELYFFVLSAYNRSGDRSFVSTARVVVQDVYDRASPNQKLIIDKGIEGKEMMESAFENGKERLEKLSGGGGTGGIVSDIKHKVVETSAHGKEKIVDAIHHARDTAVSTTKHMQDGVSGVVRHRKDTGHQATDDRALKKSIAFDSKQITKSNTDPVHTRVDEWREKVGEAMSDTSLGTNVSGTHTSKNALAVTNTPSAAHDQIRKTTTTTTTTFNDSRESNNHNDSRSRGSTDTSNTSTIVNPSYTRVGSLTSTGRDGINMKQSEIGSSSRRAGGTDKTTIRRTTDEWHSSNPPPPRHSSKHVSIESSGGGRHDLRRKALSNSSNRTGVINFFEEEKGVPPAAAAVAASRGPPGINAGGDAAVQIDGGEKWVDEEFGKGYK